MKRVGINRLITFSQVCVKFPSPEDSLMILRVTERIILKIRRGGLWKEIFSGKKGMAKLHSDLAFFFFLPYSRAESFQIGRGGEMSPGKKN